MKVFFNQNMSVDSGGYSPSGSKPAAAVADWIRRGLDIEVVDFAPAPEADLCLAHDPKFVRDVLTYVLPNGHGNRLESVTDSCLWTVGSLIQSARVALKDGITCSPSSGFHHSGVNFSSAYCTFNGLVVAALKLINDGLVRRVGIWDADAHAGNGTRNIIQTLSLENQILHWSFGYEYTPRTFRQELFMHDMDTTLRGMKSDGAELIIAQCGADPHVDDDLGGFQTTEELRERDRFLFETCSELGMPVAYCHAGGYMVDADGGISRVLELHRATAEEAIRVLNLQELRHQQRKSQKQRS